MKPVKLPRKRKKAMINATSRGDYVVYQMVSRIMLEGDPTNKTHRKFPKESYVSHGKFIVKSWW